MKKNNAKGFTLIELLAVIVIMGILFATAGTAISRIIENARKDTFIDTVKQYVNGAKNMWAADNLQCAVSAEGGAEFISSAVPNGTYYIEVDSSSSSVPQVLEEGGKSSWGKREMRGYIKVEVSQVGSTRKVKYIPVIVDGVHGVNVTVTGTGSSATSAEKTGPVEGDKLVRGDLVMANAAYKGLFNSSTNTIVLPTTNKCKEV